MRPLIRKILVGIIIAIICFAGGYFYNKNNNSIDKNLTSNKETIINPQVVGEDTKTQTEETIGLSPQKEASVPPVEPPLPIGTDKFVIGLTNTNEDIANNLLIAEFISDTTGFVNILNKDKNQVIPGAYKLSKIMSQEQINKVLHSNPYMKWVMIKPGLRKEEIAKILADNLNWTLKQKDLWISNELDNNPLYTEGVYYPDTYLIPIEEEPSLVAKRLIAKFNEKFYSYLPQFTAKNIKSTKALTLASIVQREESNSADMSLIAGILWNRLNIDIALGVDATLQYLRGDKGKGWWAPIVVADKQIDSPFNTYKYKGLPPHPISNPGISAIEAVLNPAQTDCLYYLHDENRITHCSLTYEEHLSNIQKYLIKNN